MIATNFKTRFFICLLILISLMALPFQTAFADGETTILVSVDSNEAPSYNTDNASISANGRYIAFSTYATLVEGDSNGSRDIFVRDTMTGVTTIASVNSEEEQANGDSDNPVISADGRYIAFESYASNLAIPQSGNGSVFVRDRLTGTTKLVSMDSSDPSISADGRFIAFFSANGLVSGDVNGDWDIFVRDMVKNTTRLVSVSSSEVQGNSFSQDPAISPDGRYVVFQSDASNLVNNDWNDTQDIFMRDLQAGTTVMVSVNSSQEQANAISGSPAVSAGGQFVVFTSWGENLKWNDTNHSPDVFVRDMQSGTTTCISVDLAGKPAMGSSEDASISADGRYVAFTSWAANLIIGDANGQADVFLHDNLTGTTEIVSVSSSGVQGNWGSVRADLSQDGLHVAFTSSSTNLVDGDEYDSYDIFARGVFPFTGDSTAPAVLSSSRAGANPIGANSVSFTVAFTEPVTGVNTSAPFDDFALVTTGVSGAAITSVSGADDIYTVTVKTGSGNGTIRLNVVDNDSIKDASDNLFGGDGIGNGDFNNGEEYTIVKLSAGVPVLLSPVAGSVVNSLQPVLDWRNSSPSAHHYQVQVATNNAFTSLVVDDASLPDSTFPFTSDLLPGKLYYWRIRAFNALGNASAWSAVLTFKTPLTKPTLVSPAEAEHLLIDRPTLDWDVVDGASQYTLQVSATSNFSTLLVNATLNATEYTMMKDLPQNKTLFWRVRAKSISVTSPWSLKGSFKTGNPPSVPVLVAPLNSVLVRDYSPQLNWNNSTVPVGTTFKHYEIELDDNIDFSSSTISTSTVSDFTPAMDLTALTQYYWRVRAINVVNGLDHVSGWSRVWMFRTATPPPTSLVVIPGDPNPLCPTFEWDDSIATGVTGYTIQISTKADFSTLLVNSAVPVANSSYMMIKNLPSGKTVHWRVRVNGAYGPSAWVTVQYSVP